CWIRGDRQLISIRFRAAFVTRRGGALWWRSIMKHLPRTHKRKEDDDHRSTVGSQQGKSDPLLDLHAAIGNKGVATLLQDKLQISKPGDPLEQEADRLAAEMIASTESAETGSSSGSSKQGDSKTPDGIRSEMGRRLGTDLGDVKINDGSA